MNSETPVKDILNGESEAENTVEVDVAENPVAQETVATDEVLLTECEEIIEVVEETVKKEEEVTYSPAVNIITSKKAKVPFIIGFSSVCLMAVAYLMMWIFNLALPKLGFFSNSLIIKSFFGRVMTSLVHSVIFAFAIVAIVSFIKIMVKKKAGLASNIKNINLLNSGMFIFSMFSVIDMGVIFFVSVLKHNHEVIAQTLRFMGYSGLGYDGYVKELVKADKAETFGGTLVAILYALICVVAPIMLVISYNAVKDYVKKLQNSASGAQFDKGNKAPFVFAFIAAGINFAFAVVAFISGVYIDGVIFLANTAYMVANALYVMNIHKDLLETSFD